jgi:hypothetical protein
MKLTRTTALAALLFVALAAPAAAFALADDDSGEAHHAKHDKSGHEKADKGDKSSKPEHATGEDRADEASAPGRAHAEAMKAWAQCVGEAASGQKTEEQSSPPKDACGDKPVSPGRAKHEADRQTPPGLSKDHPRGKSQSHRSQ